MEDEELCLRLQEAVQVGEECLLPLIQLAEELLRELDVEPQVVEASEVVVEELWEPPAVVARPSLGRRAMFSHSSRRASGRPSRNGRFNWTSVVLSRCRWLHSQQRFMPIAAVSPLKRPPTCYIHVQSCINYICIRMVGLGHVQGRQVGWPGVIIVEGEERNVAAYVEALSRLRWKHFVVRAEQLGGHHRGHRGLRTSDHLVGAVSITFRR